jgi:hypothetical protein
MGKNFLRSSQVYIGAHEFVDDATKMAKRMTKHESKCPGDSLKAMRRLAERIGVPYGTFWDLRYRKPKEIPTHEYWGIFVEYAKNKHKYEAERDEVAEPHSKVTAFLLRVADGAHSTAGRMAGEAEPPQAAGKDGGR